MLYIISTPIGNLEDISVRAIKTIFSVDYLLSEDTRTTGILLAEIQKRYLQLLPSNPKKPEFISYYDQIESQKTPQVIKLLESGKSCGLISESGTPLISDPGFVIVREAIKRNIKVTSIPGPTALVTALTLSGFPVHSFYFGGYLPKESGKRIKILQSLPKTTCIFYESPHRLIDLLNDVQEIKGDISIVVARELTKIHEEIFRGTVSNAITHFTNPRGEFVVII